MTTLLPEEEEKLSWSFGDFGNYGFLIACQMVIFLQCFIRQQCGRQSHAIAVGLLHATRMLVLAAGGCGLL